MTNYIQILVSLLSLNYPSFRQWQKSATQLKNLNCSFYFVLRGSPFPSEVGAVKKACHRSAV